MKFNKDMKENLIVIATFIFGVVGVVASIFFIDDMVHRSMKMQISDIKTQNKFMETQVTDIKIQMKAVENKIDNMAEQNKEFQREVKALIKASNN